MNNDEKSEIKARIKVSGVGYRDDADIDKAVSLFELLDEWKKQIATKPGILFPDDNKKHPAENYFAMDGFFPGYFTEKPKVLFIGRETRWIGGFNFCEETIKDFFAHSNVNTSAWWRTILYLLYGIRHEGKIPYAEIPCADEIAKEMLDTGKFGFAIMQLSKYSNDSEYGATRNVELMNRFLEDSELEKRNFFQEELSLLDPDIIITANLWSSGVKNEYMELCFPEKNFKSWKSYKRGSDVAYGEYDLNGKKIMLIDTFHFSARKSTEDCFYNPVMDILFKKE